MKNILLLGVSGFIGQNLSEKLVAENYNLLSFGRSKGLQENIIHIPVMYDLMKNIAISFQSMMWIA